MGNAEIDISLKQRTGGRRLEEKKCSVQGGGGVASQNRNGPAQEAGRGQIGEQGFRGNHFQFNRPVSVFLSFVFLQPFSRCSFA